MFRKKAMNKTQFRDHLISKNNVGLLETLANARYYDPKDIEAVRKEMERRKSGGLMRSDAGIKKNKKAEPKRNFLSFKF